MPITWREICLLSPSFIHSFLHSHIYPFLHLFVHAMFPDSQCMSAIDDELRAHFWKARRRRRKARKRRRRRGRRGNGENSNPSHDTWSLGAVTGQQGPGQADRYSTRSMVSPTPKFLEVNTVVYPYFSDEKLDVHPGWIIKKLVCGRLCSADKLKRCHYIMVKTMVSTMARAQWDELHVW